MHAYSQPTLTHCVEYIPTKVKLAVIVLNKKPGTYTYGAITHCVTIKASSYSLSFKVTKTLVGPVRHFI